MLRSYRTRQHGVNSAYVFTQTQSQAIPRIYLVIVVYQIFDIPIRSETDSAPLITGGIPIDILLVGTTIPNQTTLQ
jgi:hypothetical protein